MVYDLYNTPEHVETTFTHFSFKQFPGAVQFNGIKASCVSFIFLFTLTMTRIISQQSFCSQKYARPQKLLVLFLF